MIPYDYEMALKLRVIKCMLGLGDETAGELWLEVKKLIETELSDGPRQQERTDDEN